MEEANLAAKIGSISVLIVLACPAIFFFIRGLSGGSASRHWTSFALFCGLSLFVLPEFTINATDGGYVWYIACGVVRMLLGVAGTTFAIIGLATRRGRGGVGGPVAALVLGPLHLLVGLSLLLFGAFATPGTPWDYNSPDGRFALTLPSGQWKQAPSTAKTNVVAFVKPIRPQMQASVLEVRVEQTEEDFKSATDELMVRARASGAPANFRKGANAAGHRYQFCKRTETSKSGDSMYVALSVTWIAERKLVVLVIFEGIPKMSSNMGKRMESEQFEKSGELICLSVK